MVRLYIDVRVRCSVRLSLVEEIPSGENSRRHVVHTCLWNGALLYGIDKVRTKICCVRTLGDVTGHRHVQSVERTRRRLRGPPVRHDEALKAELVFQEAVERAVVLAGIYSVDEVVRTYNRSGAGHNAAKEWQRVNFVLCAVVDV